MGLLHDIQADAVDSRVSISDLLLKTQLLAAKAKNHILTDWVKYESEGYPNDVSVPSYRVMGVTYKGTFSGPFGSGINSAPIPSLLIKKHAGQKWNEYSARSSISEIQNLSENSTGRLQLSNSSDLILFMNGKIYPEFSCVEIVGELSTATLVAIQHAVRSKILALSVEMENEFPSSLEISIKKSANVVTNEMAKGFGQMTQKIVYGNNTEINTTGNHNSYDLDVSTGNLEEVKAVLKDLGLPKSDVEEFGKIISSEKPDKENEVLGPNGQRWLAKATGKAADGAWDVSVSTLSGLIVAIASKFYGIS